MDPLSNGPTAFTPVSLRGPLLDSLAFAQYLLLLAILERYLCAQELNHVAGRLAVATGLVAWTAALGAGVFVTAMGTCLARIQLVNRYK